MKNSKTVLLLILAFTLQAFALEMPKVFSDHMVLQQQEPVRLWGRAEANAAVQIQFAGQEVNTTADGQGNWSAKLEPLEASFAGRELTVKSGDAMLTFEDVLVGEVWLGSGQSNMLWRMDRSNDGDLLQLGANDPYLRLYAVNYATATEPQFSCPAVWQKDSPASAGNFSGVAYQFARDLRKTLNVPVGIIQSAVGGTPVIAWTRKGAFSAYEPLVEKHAEWEHKLSTYEEDLAKWQTEYDAWRQAKGIATEDYPRHKNQGAPEKPEGPDSPHRPASLANGMIAPVAPYTIRGVIWYQGEQDARWDPEKYGQRLGVMINDWRQWWGLPEMPFGIVQLANFGMARDVPGDEPWPKLRESQRLLAKADPHAGLVVAIDVGEADDIHPTDKFTVARRLARWALTDVYGKLSLVGGPEIAEAKLGDNAIILTFDQVGTGLRAFNSQKLLGFSVEGANGKSVKVPAEITGNNQVTLSTKGITEPKRVRYAWNNNPATANLTNQERLPASPFEISVE